MTKNTLGAKSAEINLDIIRAWDANDLIIRHQILLKILYNVVLTDSIMYLRFQQSVVVLVPITWLLMFLPNQTTNHLPLRKMLRNNHSSLLLTMHLLMIHLQSVVASHSLFKHFVPMFLSSLQKWRRYRTNSTYYLKATIWMKWRIINAMKTSRPLWLNQEHNNKNQEHNNGS